MPKRDRLGEVLLKVQYRYNGSPLSEVGKKFEELIMVAQAAISTRSLKFGQVTSVANYVEAAMELLPQSFGDRFYFDAAQIQNLAIQLSQGPVRLSQMIIPRHDREWGHLSIPMPSEPTGMHHVVDVINIPGGVAAACFVCRPPSSRAKRSRLYRISGDSLLHCLPER